MTDNRNYKSKYHQAAIIQKLGLPTAKQKFMKSRKSMTMCARVRVRSLVDSSLFYLLSKVSYCKTSLETQNVLQEKALSAEGFEQN